jgi:hypothetical protein
MERIFLWEAEACIILMIIRKATDELNFATTTLAEARVE